jgi:hypothetical protein
LPSEGRCSVPAMSNGNPAYEPIALVALIERIGIDLRERYRPTEELPASLFTLVRKLDAVEGNLLLRRMQQAPVVRGWPDNLPLDAPAWL